MGSEEYEGFVLRAAIHRTHDAESPKWVNMLTSVRPTRHVESPSYTIRPLVEPYLDLFEARLQGSIPLFLKAVLEKREMSVPLDSHRPFLGQGTVSFAQSAESIQWQEPQFHGSEDATRMFNE